jgi:HSP20 family molecular chaperone IbpA
VSGERKLKTDEKKENFHRIETSYGCFCRSFALPGSADTDNINANFNHGLLGLGLTVLLSRTSVPRLALTHYWQSCIPPAPG